MADSPRSAPASRVRSWQLVFGVVAMRAVSSLQHVRALFVPAMRDDLGVSLSELQVTIAIFSVFMCDFGPWYGCFAQRMTTRAFVGLGGLLAAVPDDDDGRHGRPDGDLADRRVRTRLRHRPDGQGHGQIGAAARTDAGPHRQRVHAAAARLDLRPHRPREHDGHGLHAGGHLHPAAGAARRRSIAVRAAVRPRVPRLGEIYSLFRATEANMFGPKHQATNLGFLLMSIAVVPVFGRPLASLVFEQPGSWTPVLLIVAGLDLPAAALALFVVKPMRRDWSKGATAAAPPANA